VHPPLYQGTVPSPRSAAGTGAAEASSTLTVHLLGSFRVTLNHAAVSAWPSGRGRSLFKYLVTHRDPWPSRETLMGTFWPNSPPESARNCLNVAVHGLRRALRAAADVPVVIQARGTYRLHPDVSLWLDVEEFEHQVLRGQDHERAGDAARATAELELAASLYQGDFLADDLCEEWPVLGRERLRLAYLDTLTRLSRGYLNLRQHAACAALCRLIIERDPCREDAHRRLMHCYSRQGQPHLALRQFSLCVEALRGEFGIDPTPATIELHRRIRDHQLV
jgi:DNA-binding SARP family transcriptional activator